MTFQALRSLPEIRPNSLRRLANRTGYTTLAQSPRLRKQAPQSVVPVPAGSLVEGEKRYWLHIALARDLNTDRTVDVLGAQLEEVTE